MTGMVLHPRIPVGNLDHVSVVSLPAGIDEVPAFTAQVSSHTTSVLDQIDAVDLLSLPPEEQSAAWTILWKYASVLQDLGCTHLITHDIPLLDNTPVCQRHCCIPPSEYELVKQHINQL